MKPIIWHTHSIKSSPWLNNIVHKRPGRPRKIPRTMEDEVIKMYRVQALGYRAIARELRKTGIEVSWQTVRRLIKERLDKNLNYRPPRCIYKQTQKQELLAVCRYHSHVLHGHDNRSADNIKHCAPILIHAKPACSNLKPLSKLHKVIDHNPAL